MGTGWPTGAPACCTAPTKTRTPICGGHRRRCGGRPGDIPHALRQDQGNHGGARADDTFGKTNAYTLRWFYLYLVKEYARHLGHADLLRERIDGVTGE